MGGKPASHFFFSSGQIEWSGAAKHEPSTNTLPQQAYSPNHSRQVSFARSISDFEA
jgi:hypothetical protein